MIPGFLFDLVAFPRYLAAVLPWWVLPIAAGWLWAAAGGVRAGARLALALVAIAVVSFVAASIWLNGHPATANPAPAEAVEGDMR